MAAITTLREWAARCHVTCHADFAVQGFSVDSRTLKPRDLFFALPGVRTDGHSFLEQAAIRQAAGAVVHLKYRGGSYGLPLIYVENVLQTLQQLARDCLKRANPRVLAITGSVGKTTTKEWTYQFLSSQCTAVDSQIVRSPGSCNSQIGLPLSILQLFGLIQEKDKIPSTFIAEMGMTEPEQIKILASWIAPPEIALITAVELVHAGRFSGEEAIAAAKGEIFSSPNTRIGIIPSDVAGFDTLQALGDCTKRTFSIHNPSAHYRLTQEQRGETHFYTLHTPTGSYPLGTWHLPGKHALHNLLAACSLSCEYGMNPEHIAPLLPQLSFPDKRLQQIVRNGILFINDSFNAPPVAVEAALSILPVPKSNGRRIAVLGTMPDLGAFCRPLHEKIGKHALNCVDILLCLGEETLAMHDIWKEAGRPSLHFISKTELSHHLNTFLKPNDVVLIKGKNTLRMWTLIEEEA